MFEIFIIFLKFSKFRVRLVQYYSLCNKNDIALNKMHYYYNVCCAIVKWNIKNCNLTCKLI